MAVKVHRQLDRRMAQALRNLSRVDTFRDWSATRGCAGGRKSSLRQSGIRDDLLKPAAHVRRVQGRPTPRREDQCLDLPRCTCQHLRPPLRRPMSTKCIGRDRRDFYRPTTAWGLRISEREPLISALLIQGPLGSMEMSAGVFVCALLW
jgi:hypothetical protein